ncbi:shikimate kinase-domain-containing protein [Myxozyma melibiosi]|uniref:Shikimate kinase-domain-containing protein n=1 Tax=Myxozyma melibiosi TaxID=54550 RepID=A0ABR1F5Z9_9ASCO
MTTSADVSVALIGMHGVGKSTLALIASRALGFRFVDTDHNVQTALGMPPFSYIKEHSLSEYRVAEHEVLADLLKRCTERCVIACGAAAIEYPPNRQLFSEFSKHHPVIHIVCDEDRIVQYLNAPDPSVVYRMCRQRYAVYRECANFEFFNLTAHRRSRTDPEGDQRQLLMLKNLELDFVRFLKLIMRREQDEVALIKVQHPEARRYTYSISLRFPPPHSLHSGLDDYVNDYVESNSVGDRVMGADCVEVIVDAPIFRRRSLQLESIGKFVGIIRRQTRLPIIFSISCPDSYFSQPEVRDFYFELLEYGMRLITRYINIDLSHFTDFNSVKGDGEGVRNSYHLNSHYSRLADILSTKSPIPFAIDNRISSEQRASYHRQIMGSWHHTHTPDESATVNWWDSGEPELIMENALSFCNIVRLSKEATCFYDNEAVSAFHHRNGKRLSAASAHLSAFNTGPMGRLSRIFNHILTPVVAYYPNARSNADNTLLQSHDISAYDAQVALYTACALPRLQFYLFGGPQSPMALSPSVMNAGFRALGLPHTHTSYQSADPEDMLSLIARPDFGGIGITLPYKQAAVRMADTLSEHARVIGAVNTLIPEHAHDNMQITTIRGENTDWICFYNAIIAHLTPVNSIHKKTTALVIGAGGSARAVIYACIRLGVEDILIYNRTAKHAQELANHFNSLSPLRLSTPHSTDRTPSPTPADEVSLSREIKFKVHALDSLDAPEAVAKLGLEMPTIIVSAISAYMEFPLSWFDRPTGGVFMEVLHVDDFSKVLNTDFYLLSSTINP